jgi:hypothetical protein
MWPLHHYSAVKDSANASELGSARIRRIKDRGEAELDALLSELRMLAKFDHPNIVRYYAGWLEYILPTSLNPVRSPRLLEGPKSESDETSENGTKDLTDSSISHVQRVYDYSDYSGE